MSGISGETTQVRRSASASVGESTQRQRRQLPPLPMSPPLSNQLSGGRQVPHYHMSTMDQRPRQMDRQDMVSQRPLPGVGQLLPDPAADASIGIRRSSKSIRRLSAYRPGAAKLAIGEDTLHQYDTIQPVSAPSSTGASERAHAPTTSQTAPGRARASSSSDAHGDSTPTHNITRPTLPNRPSSTAAEGTTQRVIFLQVGRDTKRIAFPLEPITIDMLRGLFQRHFARFAKADTALAIQIRDPAVGVYYSLENLAEVRDRSILRVRVPEDDPFDILRRRVDAGFSDIASAMASIQSTSASQHAAIRELSDNQSGLVTAMQQQQEKVEAVVAQIELLQQQQDASRAPAPVSAGLPDTSIAHTATKGLQRELRQLRDEVASIRMAYNQVRKESAQLVAGLEGKCIELRDTLDRAESQHPQAARSFIIKGQTDMDARTEAIASRIEDAEDLSEEIKRDLTQRRSVPSAARMKALGDALTFASSELKALNALVEEARPKWKRAWESELKAVLQEQQFLKDQEELLVDLGDDQLRLSELQAQLTQVVELKSKQRPQKQRSMAVVTAEEGHLHLNQVMQEITCIDPDSSRRMQALEQAEKMRRLEQANNVDEFEQELGTFVADKKLRPTGGVDEAERRREERRQETLRAMLSS